MDDSAGVHSKWLMMMIVVVYIGCGDAAAADDDDDDDDDDTDEMSVVDTGTVNERVFLDDNNDQVRQSPLDLGAFPHECIGNVNLCPNGFTWAAWYKPQPANRQVGLT